MMRKLIFCFSLLAGAAQAASISGGALIGSSGSTNVSNSATRYISFMGIGTPDANKFISPSTVTLFTHSADISWTATNMYCFSGTNPGTGKSYAITATTNGAAFNETCTISDAATSCSDTSHTTSVGFGQSGVGFGIVPSGTPTATTISCYMEYTVP